MSCADLRREELPYIINKLNTLWLSDEELEWCSQERCDLLNNNTVLLAMYFSYNFEEYFKEIILDDTLGKTRHYFVRTEFQEKGSPHVHLFI